MVASLGSLRAWSVLIALSGLTYVCYVGILPGLPWLQDAQLSLTVASPKPCGIACLVEDSSHFLIHTPECVIPDFDPDHPSIAKFKAKNVFDLKCSSKPDLTEVDKLTLVLLEDHLQNYNISVASLNCTYQPIIRVEQDPKKYNGDCDKKFKLEAVVPIMSNRTAIQDDSILVTCFDMTKNKAEIYKNVHYFIQPEAIQEKQRKFQEKYGEWIGDRRDKLSVVVMGTDAVSRGNLRRHMPKTFRYLKEELQAIDFQGYTKVGDNTDPNMIAALMGLTDTELKKHKCMPKKNSKFDDCPLIWKEFSKDGYVTAFGEDAAWMGIFHFNKVGYVKKPTDFYNRPFFLASEKYISHSAGHKGYNGRLCQGGKKSICVIHDYSLAIAEATREVPHFGFYWNAAISHDYLTSTTAADKPSLDYLKEFKRRGYLDHTILFFISDHGLRWGDFRSTYPGMLEERLPYVLAVFPPWFKEEHPQAWKNLLINTKRLTSTFDLHVTLEDILHRAYADLSSSPRKSLHGQSLFREVPKNRTCADAGVPEHYCACEESHEIDAGNPLLKRAAESVVQHLNKNLKKFKGCAQLSLDKVIRGRVGSPTNHTRPKANKALAFTYNVAFVTEPGGGELEATVRYHEDSFELTASASRINAYGNQSHCITDDVYRKYCFCKDLLT